MKPKIISVEELLDNNKFIIQVGVDKNNNPVFVGDIVVEDVSYEYSSDYYNGLGERTVHICKHEVTKTKCEGKIYREVTFNGKCFELKRVKEEGYLPIVSSYSVWASQEELNKYEKV